MLKRSEFVFWRIWKKSRPFKKWVIAPTCPRNGLPSPFTSARDAEAFNSHSRHNFSRRAQKNVRAIDRSDKDRMSPYQDVDRHRGTFRPQRTGVTAKIPKLCCASLLSYFGRTARGAVLLGWTFSHCYQVNFRVHLSKAFYDRNSDRTWLPVECWWNRRGQNAITSRWHQNLEIEESIL